MSNNIYGLSSEEVQERKLKGLDNAFSASNSKTIKEIIFGNIFTLFNAVNFVIFLLILITGKYINTLFMGVIISNTLIGIIQETRAKRIIDNLKVITAVKALVIRNKVEQEIAIHDIVIGDICIVSSGNQVSCDGVVVESQELEVDESLLTGESDSIIKKPGDKILSGSFVVAGKGIAKVECVGKDNYAQKITLEAQKYKRAHSEILTVVNKIIKIISLIIGPVGILLFSSQFSRTKISWQDAIINSATGIIGMIPEGLVLLTTIAFAVGIMKLAKRRTIIQELAGIEVLARTDVLCLDKTGTLTKGTLEVSEVVELKENLNKEELNFAISAVVGAFEDNNATAKAIITRFNNKPEWKITKTIPFSSARKWSGVTFEGHGSFVIGAPEFILKENYKKELDMAQSYAEKGYRVILLAHSPNSLEGDTLLDGIAPYALILLLDTIRPEAKGALDYFAENGVEIKVISGDNAATVASVAKRLNLKNADKYIDATKLPQNEEEIAKIAKEYTVFGRVSPQQKKQLIKSLKMQENIVAMTGDGVNDVLALREADCGIAMASGSDAAKNTAHIVLLDSDFATLPGVVAEGRQVINNIERVASLFLVKTTFSVILSLFFIIMGLAYPFYPIHQTLIGATCIGIPSFFLALEKNSRRVEPGFLKKVILTALPGGFTIALNIMFIQLLQKVLVLDNAQVRLISVLVTGVIGLIVLYRISMPLNIIRGILFISMLSIFCGSIFIFGNLIDLPMIDFNSFIITSTLSIIAFPLIFVIKKIIQRIT